MGVRTLGRGWTRGWTGAWAAVLLLAGYSEQGARAQQAPEGQAPAQAPAPRMLRYVRAAESGAKALNLPDTRGVQLLEVPARGLLAVHDERGGWLEVESPGGFPVWVYGEFLKESSVPGMVEVTGNDVRMRPLPSSGTESFPLGQHLSKGERVRMIRRNDAARALDKDWVQVWSPAGARAWVAASETQPLESGASGAALWASAVKEAKEAAVAAAVAPRADAAKSRDAMQAAEAALARERAKPEPDFDAVRKGFEGVLALEPDEETAKAARARLEEVQVLAEARALEADLARELARREAELLRRQRAMEEAGKRGVFDGRFEVRGRLERKVVPGEQEPVYLVRFAGNQHTELVCLSGRFDLAAFEGCEVGVNGRQLRGAVPASVGAPPRPAQVDVARLEVLAARPRR